MPARMRNFSAAMCVTVPTPELPQVMPGFFFASAISSLADFTPSEGCATMISGDVETGATAIKSRCGLYESLEYSDGVMACVDISVNNSV